MDAEGLHQFSHDFLEKQLKHHQASSEEVEAYVKDYGHIFELYDRMKRFASCPRLSKIDVQAMLEKQKAAK